MNRYSTDQITSWAFYYLKPDTVLKDVQEFFKVADSTIWYCFMKRLFRFDKWLYKQVNDKLSSSPCGRGHKRLVCGKYRRRG